MKSGDIIADRYRLDRKIGEGSTGRIWLAQDSRLDRRVAIKFLFAGNRDQQARLVTRVALEARIAASIQHRNVVQIFDFGAHEGNIPFIVMEALSGHTLGEAFCSARSLSLDALIHILGEVLRGLSAVHDAGIVHRDLKPANIFLVKEARGRLSAKLLDFGISRSLEPETRSSAVATTEGMILGTPQYMAPEQARGDSEGIDERTDIYSIGTIMFEAFSGFVPFPSRNTTELLISIVQDPAPPLYDMVPQIGEKMCAVVDKALSKDRAGRYAHAAEMLDAVTAAALESPAELDRAAPLFPLEAIRDHIQPLWSDPTTEILDGPDSSPPLSSAAQAAVPQTMEDPGGQRRVRRSQTPGPLQAGTPLTDAVTSTRRPARALWLALTGLIVFGVSIAVASTLIERNRQPEGSGMIVVQAPSQTLAAAAQQPAPASPPAPDPVDVAADAPAKKAAVSGKARKPASADPLQLMASRVAEAFTRQKAGVVACLNEHAAELGDASQLQVRLVIDNSGMASEAELLPATISGNPVARCLKSAVTRMSFPRQDAPTTFRVPLSWRRK